VKDVTLSKGAFVLSHTGINIRDDYLIGKVVGTGIHPAFLTQPIPILPQKLEV